MKITVNALQVAKKNSGIGIYIINLVGELIQNHPADYLIYHSQDADAAAWFTRGKARFREIKADKHNLFSRNFFEIFQFAWDVRKNRPDIFFAPDTKLPWGLPKRMKKIVTVHDLAVFKYPETYQKSRVLYWRLLFSSSVHRADRVVVISESTKRDVQELFRISEDKISVIYNGVGAEFKPLGDSDRCDIIRAKYSLPEKYILFVGIFSPRKNLGRLIEAFAELRQAGLPHKLVIAGETGWKFHQDLSLVEELGLSEEIHFPGYIDEADLPYLYSLADVLAYPSIYEGFGLPLLEAMACGTPVVASQTSAMPEVVGAAGLLVDPYSVPEIAAALQRVLLDRDLHHRLSAAGIARAKLFSWQQAAAQLSDLFNQMGQNNGSKRV